MNNFLENTARAIAGFSLALIVAGFLLSFCEVSVPQPKKGPIEDINRIDINKVANNPAYLFYGNYWPFILSHECGPHKTCCNKVKGDKGGYTCFGMSSRAHKTFHAFVRQHAKLLTVKQIEFLAANHIFEDYYRKTGIDKLALSWRLPVLDYAINAGPKQAIVDLQRVLNVKADGLLGKKTVRKSLEKPDKKYINAYQDRRSRFYTAVIKKDGSQKRFERGWMRRTNDLRL